MPGQELPADFMVGIRGEPEQCGHWWEQGASEALEKTGRHFQQSVDLRERQCWKALGGIGCREMYKPHQKWDKTRNTALQISLLLVLMGFQQVYGYFLCLSPFAYFTEFCAVYLLIEL